MSTTPKTETVSVTEADRAVIPVETMTAMEMSTALLAGLMVLGDPVGECHRPVIGRYQMLKASEIIDLVRRRHMIPLHRSYVERLIELLSPTPPAPQPLTAERSKAIEVSGIMLRRSGVHVIVEAEITGRWVEVIRELHDTNFSHIVEPAGMLAAFGIVVGGEVGK